ncbi:MAG: hypothetical protein AB8G86_23145 [Saprospiraceae bacterium]
MQKNQPIQDIVFTNLYEKDFEFTVVTNREVLRDNVPEHINPFQPSRYIITLSYLF